MDLQVDLRRTLEAEPEAEREPDREQDVVPSIVDDTPPLLYPQESPLMTADGSFADADINFSEELPALSPDNDELVSDAELDADPDETPDEVDSESEGETAVRPLPLPRESRLAPLAPQTPRRTVAGPERLGVASTDGGCIAYHRWSSHTGLVRRASHTRRFLLHLTTHTPGRSDDNW